MSVCSQERISVTAGPIWFSHKRSFFYVASPPLNKNFYFKTSIEIGGSTSPSLAAYIKCPWRPLGAQPLVENNENEHVLQGRLPFSFLGQSTWLNKKQGSSNYILAKLFEHMMFCQIFVNTQKVLKLITPLMHKMEKNTLSLN